MTINLFMAKLWHLVLLGLLLFKFQVNAGPTIKPDLPDPTPTTGRLAKRVDALAALWTGVPDKVPVGGHKGWIYEEVQQSQFSTAEFYGCTIVIIADGAQTYIGHFNQAQGNCAQVLTDAGKTKSTITGPMNNDLPFHDFQDDAKAWIVHSLPSSSNGVPSNALGYDDLVKFLQDYIPNGNNIQPIAYSAGSGTGEFPGLARGKAVVTRDTVADGGSTVKVYIQNDNPVWTQNFDAQCNPRRKAKRDGAACTPTGSSSATTGATTPPSCTYMGPSPPEQPQASCECNGTTGFPLTTLTANLPPESSCAWSTLPTSTQSEPNNPLGPPTTDSKACQICTRYAVNEDNCQSMPNCVKQLAQATVQAGSSPVHVGTLTDKALSTAISSAIDKACPSVTSNSVAACQTDGVTIDKIDYKDSEGLMNHFGSLLVKVEASSYNDSSIRKAMIDAAALTAMQGATGKNCYQDDPNLEPTKFKRAYDTFQDSFNSLMPRSLHVRFGEVEPIPEKVTWCNTVSFAGVQYYGEFARLASTLGATDYLNVNWNFQVEGGDAFDCAFIGDLVDALAVLAPEFVVEDVALGEEITATCEAAMALTGNNKRDLLGLPQPYPVPFVG